MKILKIYLFFIKNNIKKGKYNNNNNFNLLPNKLHNNNNKNRKNN